MHFEEVYTILFCSPYLQETITDRKQPAFHVKGRHFQEVSGSSEEFKRPQLLLGHIHSKLQLTVSKSGLTTYQGPTTHNVSCDCCHQKSSCQP